MDNIVKELFCHNCDDYRPVKIIQKREVYLVKGEEIELDTNVCICSICGEELFDYENDEKNLENAFLIYRKKHGLLSPDEIKGIREMYGLSQRTFSKLLRWGEVTMNRYENGAIPDKAHNNMLLLLKNPYNMLEVLNNNHSVLTLSKEKKLRSRIEELLSENAITSMITYDKLFSSDCNIYTGFKEFDFNKFKSLVLYFCSFESRIYKTKLMKLLWYTDYVFFKNKTFSMTGAKYARLPYGPVVENRNLLLGLIESQKAIEIIEDDETGGDYIIAKAEFNDLNLDDEEEEVAKLVYNKFKDFNCNRISDYSHNEIAWKNTKTGDLISYEDAQYINFNY